MQQLESKIHRIEALLASTPRTTDATRETPSSVVSPRYVRPESGVGLVASAAASAIVNNLPRTTSIPALSICNASYPRVLNMVLAIGGVRLFRQGITNLHPFGFFTAALEASPPSSSSFSTLEDIENLLLIARLLTLGSWPVVHPHRNRAQSSPTAANFRTGGF
ncbi:Pyrimidine pathway regulatory 1 [Fusarium albosuccineum]|uniref:Pyrimidine pathway regulatory 1 n=1 Tax=Fusarium albosuccineum TaxID=1237068 RepID=A0A8H4LEA1_9HYPO|nr:Pyrimidine pathway regulatory 1 [Fusarium albosuccineum]